MLGIGDSHLMDLLCSCHLNSRLLHIIPGILIQSPKYCMDIICIDIIYMHWFRYNFFICQRMHYMAILPLSHCELGLSSLKFKALNQIVDCMRAFGVIYICVHWSKDVLILRFKKFLQMTTTEHKTCQNLGMKNKVRINISAPERWGDRDNL
jgi:hypothetical protein